MFEPPPRIAADDAVEYADWVELCALADPDGVVSQADIVRALGEEEAFGGPGDPSGSDTMASLVDNIWGTMTYRARILKGSYPLDIDGDLVSLNVGSWQHMPSFTAMLLMANIARFRRDLELERKGGFTFRQLFEKIVQAAARGLFAGPSVRFGVPIEPGWPTPLSERVQRLSGELGLTVGKAEEVTNPTDNDLTVDVFARLRLGDHDAGSLLVMIQCATGRHWQSKTGEPNLTKWDNILVWDCTRVKALAVPWWFADSKRYAQEWRRFDKAIILDRRRLLAGAPDDHLDERYNSVIVEWCEEQMARLPRLN